MPIAEPYREPACDYCPGHRGLGYRTTPGTAVRAVAAGRVTFAGPVAGVRWVVVRHGDDLRSSYGELRSVRVRVGQAVAAGEVLGETGPSLHLGLRRGDRYVDPAPLLGRAVRRARLVPERGGRPGVPRRGSGRRSGPSWRVVCGAVAVGGTRSPR